MSKSWPVFLPWSPVNQFDSEEGESLLQASESFEKDAARFYPDRPCLTTVIDLTGKTIFITRYIRPLNPPKEFLDGVASSAQEVSLAWWVNKCNLSRCSVVTLWLFLHRPWLPGTCLSSLPCQTESCFQPPVTSGAHVMWVKYDFTI